ncbi:IS30 family transposase [Arthrobacter sp. TMP15]|uniref:IS30 family transposase n=1 Tax=Arthrobacter sp. TMP15 TaxID=3140789 RepID=UPI0031B9F1AC
MSVAMANYSILFRPDLLQVFWAGMQAGDFITDAVIPINTSRRTGRTVLANAGGVRPRRGRNLKGRCLTFTQREEIAILRAQGQSLRAIGEVIGRSASTVSRELRRNTKPGTAYRATSAHMLAYERASRPKPAKLHTNIALRTVVEADLAKKYSPEQIAGRLRVQFPNEEEMRVSPETIYQSLYVQSRGALNRDLVACLRTGRAVRRPSRKTGQRKNRIPGMINISHRPPEVEDRAVPGHWEGDLIIGKGNQTAIGTLVERNTNYTMLVHLPQGYKAEQMREALTAKIKTLPQALRHSLTWDQGIEMQDWKTVKIDTGIEIYFCDPHSPWQRGINENTNGLLRQYFPKGTDLSIHSAQDLDWVAAELNDRPRKRLEFKKPIELIEPLLLQ